MLNMNDILRSKSSVRCIITYLTIIFTISSCGYMRRSKPLKISPELYSTLSKVEVVRITGPGSNLSDSIIKKLRSAHIAIVWQSEATSDLTIEFDVTHSHKPASIIYVPKGFSNNHLPKNFSNNRLPKKLFYNVKIFSIITVYDRNNTLICRDKIICTPSLPERVHASFSQKDIYILATNKFKKIFKRRHVAKLIDILVSRRISNNIRIKSPLWIASKDGNVEDVKLLLEANAEVDMASIHGVTPLWVASQEGHNEVVKLLIASNANVDTAKTDGVTPLFMASENGHIEIVKLLLEAKANIHAGRKTDGATPIWQASWKGHIETVKLLLSMGADVNTADTNGVTPLWVASQGGHSDIVNLLVAARADVNVSRKTDGVTPLWQASWKGHIETVKLLLEAGADVSMRANINNTNYTPLDIAKEKSHIRIIKLLKKYGAKD